jgi:hypothetical protein
LEKRYTDTMRKTLLAAACCAALAALALSPQTAYESKAITILYSGDTYGELESCG